MGWGRWSTYFRHRVGRLPGSPQSIAIGFACGAAVSFTPFIGLHILVACGVAWLAGGSLLAAALGTIVGNPWTFPFIWLGVYRLGILILGGEAMALSLSTLTFTHLREHFWDIFVPMAVGSLPVAILVWLVFFFLIRTIVARYQQMRRKRIAKRRMREIKAARAEREAGEDASAKAEQDASDMAEQDARATAQQDARATGEKG